jgi:hypothetical protein
MSYMNNIFLYLYYILGPAGTCLPDHQASCQAPYKWRHAKLESIRKDLKVAINEGRYDPVLKTGLNWV